MRPVSALRNLGPKSAMVLLEVGIRTADDVCELGAVKAYARAKALHPNRVSLNLLWALAAGLENRHWRDLAKDEKDALIAQLRSLRR